MATITKSELADLILEHLTVKDPYNNANYEDSSFVQQAIDSAYDELNKILGESGGLPFELSAVPDWAQFLLRDYVAGDCAQSYGHTGQTLLEYKGSQEAARARIREQMSGYVHSINVMPEFF